VDLSSFWPWAGPGPGPWFYPWTGTGPGPWFFPYSSGGAPAVFTLFGQPATPATLTADPTNYNMGVAVTVSRAVQVNAIWFYSAPGAASLPQTIALWQNTGPGTGTLVASQAAAWSGAAGSGWVRAPFTIPPAMTTGNQYKPAILHTSFDNFYSTTAHYWDTGAGAGGITSGPLTAPNNAGADAGQDTFHGAIVLTYPDTSFNAANYWVDVEVQ
jgi:hypothetical protein